jgi:Spy/CpxP family protein refolding chaperone
MSRLIPSTRWRRITDAAAGFAAAATRFTLVPSAEAGWGRWGRHRSAETVDELRERMHDSADWILSRADASDEQERAVLAVLDEAAPEIFARKQRMQLLRDRASAALKAKRIDRTELERIRVTGLEEAQAASVHGLEVLAQIADILTPAQRIELVETWERWHR